MASGIRCEVEECGNEHAIILIPAGDAPTMTLCFDHYVGLSRQVVEAADESEREAATEAAEARLAAATPPGPDPAGTVVVPRGTSRSRKAYEARRRAAAAKVAPEPTTPAAGAPGGSSEPTGDAADP